MRIFESWLQEKAQKALKTDQLCTSLNVFRGTFVHVRKA